MSENNPVQDFVIETKSVAVEKVEKPVKINKTQEKKIQQLLADLNSSASGKVTTALDSLQVYGDSSIIFPLFDFLKTSKNEKSKAEVLEFLCNLKDTNSKTKVMECLNDKNYLSVRIEIMTAIWNCPINFSEYLHDFVKIAVENDYLECLECLTIIENLDGPFEEKALFESLLLLKDYHEGKYPKNKEKDVLISEIALLIKDFDRDTDED
ncbi:MAG: hypothetical protein V4622_01115 [Bacteroidota bacterium]